MPRVRRPRCGIETGIESEQRLGMLPRLRIDLMLGAVTVALFHREIGQLVKELLDGRVHSAISLRSQAWASRRSRRTTCTEIERTEADSSAVMPPK